MRQFYPKLMAGRLVFTPDDLAGGGAFAMPPFGAVPPMVALFRDPSTVSQIAIVAAARGGIVTAAVTAVLGSANAKKAVQAELFRAQFHGVDAANGSPVAPRRR